MNTGEKSTKDRLLEAAERLFADEGIHPTSLRRITEKAGTNLAAVNYHFHTKTALAEAVIARRLIRINEERLRLLDDAEDAAGKGDLSIESVLRAFFGPMVGLWIESPHFTRLMGRLQYEPDERLHRFFLSHFDEVIRRFGAAMTRALPNVPRKELIWRMGFLIGGMCYTCICYGDLEQAFDELCTVDDPSELFDRLIAFGAAGMRALRPGNSS